MLCLFLLDNHFLTVPDDNAAIAVGYELTAEVVGGICGSDGLDLHLLDTSDVALLAKHGIITAILKNEVCSLWRCSDCLPKQKSIMCRVC